MNDSEKVEAQAPVQESTQPGNPSTVDQSERFYQLRARFARNRRAPLTEQDALIQRIAIAVADEFAMRESVTKGQQRDWDEEDRQKKAQSAVQVEASQPSYAHPTPDSQAASALPSYGRSRIDAGEFARTLAARSAHQ